jgi:hypothetical protein
MSSLEWLVIGSVYAAKLVRVTRVGSSGNGYLLYVVAMSDLTHPRRTLGFAAQNKNLGEFGICT